MRKRNLLLLATILLGCWSVAVLADEGGAFVEGKAAAGAHTMNPVDNVQRVGEYVNLHDTEELLTHMYLDLFGGTENTLYSVNFLYHDSATKKFDFGVDTDSYVSADVDYQSFMHNLDHDALQNMQGKAGGKQVYHTDNDPLGRYFLEYSEFNAGVKIDLPFLEGGQIYGSYHDQKKAGYKQRMTIDHCAFCHVESNIQRVDQQTETWAAGIKGTAGSASFQYELAETKYRSNADAMERTWLKAVHPVFGVTSDFPTRQIFQDVTMPYARSTSNDKTSHNASLKFDLANRGMLKGSYTNTNRSSWWTGEESQFDAYAVGYAVKLHPKMRLTAKFLTYETKIDDHFIDLPDFRDGMVNGDLDFDWNRISSANRKVYQGDVGWFYRVATGRSLKASWRYQVIDRDAMAQSQTNYLFSVDEGVTDDSLVERTLVASEPYENKTKINRLKLRYDARVGTKGNYNLNLTYTGVDKPFMNPTAMCEESLEGTQSAHVNDADGQPTGRLYYFQRQRFGNGTNQASQAMQFMAKGSYRLNSRTSVNAFLTYAKDKNDELNVYEFERDLFTPGVNFWTAPTDRVLFTLGWTFNKVKSNENLCVPIFDG